MHSYLNSILIEGKLTADPVLKVAPSGGSVTELTIASVYVVDGMFSHTSYVDIEVYGKLGENCAELLEKGRGIRVVGRLHEDRWTSAGKQMSRLKVIGEHIEFRPQFEKDEAEEEALMV